MLATCSPAENTATTDQADFWDGRWDAHEIGWVIAGATALAVRSELLSLPSLLWNRAGTDADLFFLVFTFPSTQTTIISLYSILQHARNYYNPKQQRQVLRIMGMPAVYAIVSFFSYRYFRSYTYYSVAVVAYESLVLAAFLMLLLQYIGESTDAQKEVLRGKEKKKIPFPFWCVRYRPSKPCTFFTPLFAPIATLTFHPPAQTFSTPSSGASFNTPSSVPPSPSPKSSVKPLASCARRSTVFTSPRCIWTPSTLCRFRSRCTV